MPRQYSDEAYQGSIPENYERYFVPAIGAPMANGLIEIVAPAQGERILDVACGTGVIARLASQRVGESGTVAGLDMNPGMLAVARTTTPPGTTIDWHEAGAEAMSFPDESFDALVCQMGLQFMPDKHAALTEMRRVLVPGGRLVLSVPGPIPSPLDVLGQALTRHIGPEAAGFVNQVFSLHDTDEIQSLVRDAGFRDVSVQADTRSLRLPAPGDFLWQFVHSTPLAAAVAGVNDEQRSALERDVMAGWQQFEENGALALQVRMVVATARR